MTPPAGAALARPTMQISMRVNGRAYDLTIEPRETLLEVLRVTLGLTGTKLSCDVQVCGACTVLLDGLAVSACTVLAYEARNRDVLTIEGVADGETLHPLQEAFIDHAALQCGYCTPGMILAAKALLSENPRPTTDEIKHYMRGNICRCTGYKKILEAIVAVSNTLTGQAAAGDGTEH
jgi:carbon-monoxide dehydrogenase small subunit